jgi:hypothetical protein
VLVERLLSLFCTDALATSRAHSVEKRDVTHCSFT